MKLHAFLQLLGIDKLIISDRNRCAAVTSAYLCRYQDIRLRACRTLSTPHKTEYQNLYLNDAYSVHQTIEFHRHVIHYS